MEVAIALLLKSGIKRVYTTSGSICAKTIIDDTKTSMHLEPYGYISGMIFIAFELAVGLFSSILYIPWFLSENPIGPAIRLVQERSFFNKVVVKNSVANILRERPCLDTRIDIWSRLDVRLRMGEAIVTVQDPEEGV